MKKIIVVAALDQQGGIKMRSKIYSDFGDLLYIDFYEELEGITISFGLTDFSDEGDVNVNFSVIKGEDIYDENKDAVHNEIEIAINDLIEKSVLEHLDKKD